MRSIVELGATWDRGFRLRVSAAPKPMIDELDRLAGPLPDDYVDFLQTMGRSTGGLGSADWQIDRVLGRHRAIAASSHAKLRAVARRYLFVGFHDTEDGAFEDVHLDRQASPPMVFESSSVTAPEYDCREDGWYTAASLEEYWIAEAFRTLRVDRFPHTIGLCALGTQGWSHDHPSHASHLESVAARLGFEPLTAEQLISRCFEREDAGIVAHQAPG